MPELILPRAIRGMANALGFPGGRTGPRGVDLSIDPQTVVDLSSFARYGAARLGGPGDGWISAGVSVVGGGAGVVTTAPLSVNQTAFPAMQPGDVFWVRHAGIQVFCSAALADFGDANLNALPAPSASFGPFTANRINLCGGFAADVSRIGANSGVVVARHFDSWWPLPQGSSLEANLFQAAAAGTCDIQAVVIGRILPQGVEP